MGGEVAVKIVGAQLLFHGRDDARKAGTRDWSGEQGSGDRGRVRRQRVSLKLRGRLAAGLFMGLEPPCEIFELALTPHPVCFQKRARRRLKAVELSIEHMRKSEQRAGLTKSSLRDCGSVQGGEVRASYEMLA